MKYILNVDFLKSRYICLSKKLDSLMKFTGSTSIKSLSMFGTLTSLAFKKRKASLSKSNKFNTNLLRFSFVISTNIIRLDNDTNALLTILV